MIWKVFNFMKLENKMFKKTLIAAAVVATTAAFGANAATVAPGTDVVGVEYAEAVMMKEIAVSLTVGGDTAADYAEGDVVKLKVGGAKLAFKDGDLVTTPSVTAGNVSYLSSEGDDTILLLVLNGGVSDGDTISVDGLTVSLAGAADKGKVTVASEAIIDTVVGPVTIDKGAAATQFTYASQLSSAVKTKLSKVVDVNDGRKEFTDETGADTIVLTTTSADLTDEVDVDSVTYTVYGDFSFLDADGDGKLGGDDDGMLSGDAELAEDLMSITLEQDIAAATVTESMITITAPGSVVIPDQMFTASAEVAYTTGSGDDEKEGAKTTLTMADAGEWTLNGADAYVPFLPFGSAYSQSITVSNTSTQTGGVDLVIFANGETVEVEGIATVGAKGVTDISAAVRAAVAEAGLTGNLALEIVINAPEEAITVKAVYYAKADGDRVLTK